MLGVLELHSSQPAAAEMMSEREENMNTAWASSGSKEISTSRTDSSVENLQAVQGRPRYTLPNSEVVADAAALTVQALKTSADKEMCPIIQYWNA